MLIFFKSFVVWILLILAESVNGTLRMFWLVPNLGDVGAHQLSFGVASGLVLAIATLLIPWLQASSMLQFIQIGLLWLGLTLGFEISVGHLVLGYSWPQIAADYDLLHGGLMPIGLLLLTVAPLIAAKLRGVLPSHQQENLQQTVG